MAYAEDLVLDRWIVQTDTPDIFRASRRETISTFDVDRVPDSLEGFLLDIEVEINAPEDSVQYNITAGVRGAASAGNLWLFVAGTRDEAIKFLNQEMLTLDDDDWIDVFIERYN